MDEVKGGQKTKVPGDHQSRDVHPQTDELHKHQLQKEICAYMHVRENFQSCISSVWRALTEETSCCSGMFDQNHQR